MGYELLVMGYVVVAELVEATSSIGVRFDRLNDRVSTNSTTAVMSNEAERSETSHQKRKINFV